MQNTSTCLIINHINHLYISNATLKHTRLITQFSLACFCETLKKWWSLFCAESGDVKASVAVLSFIFSSAAKYDVDSESLSSELQQLGLPKG